MSPPIVTTRSDPPTGPSRPSRAEIAQHLERILSSPDFHAADRLSRFLRYVVEQTLEGHGDALKEFAIAVDVFGRDPSFDPRFDSLVRVEAHRLRAKLSDYYSKEGARETVRLNLPKGHYAVEFLTAPTGPMDSESGAVPGDDSPRGAALAVWLQKTRWKWGLAAVTGMIIVVIASVVMVHQQKVNPALAESDVVVISDFLNLTGESLFDDALKQAVTIQLSQSPYLNILPDARVRSTLRLMKKPSDAKLTPDVALEVCLRAAGKAVIQGSIARVGGQYVLGLEAINCQTGRVLAREQITAPSRERVVGTLSNEAAELRRKLGESLASVRTFDVPLNRATTSSLEALKAYSVGLEKDKTNDAEAIPFFKRAIDLDPSFASAYEGLAVCYYNLGESGLARDNFAKAFNLDREVSEREKFTIDARYYNYVTGDLEKAIETYQLWVEAYPRSAAAHEDLGGLYGATGQFQKAVTETHLALPLEPHGGGSYANLILSYAALNQFDEAKAIYQQGVAQGVDDPVMRIGWFGVAFLEGDTAELDRQMKWSTARPEAEDLFLSAKSDTEAYFGHLREARSFSRRAEASANRSGQSETAAFWAMDEAIREAEFANSKIARDKAAASLALNRNYDTEILAALVYARAHDSHRAGALATELARQHPADTLINYYWLPVIQAGVALDHNNPLRAIGILKATDPYEFASPDGWPTIGAPLYPSFLRGNSYLRLGRGREAAAEFTEMIDRRGLMKASPLAPLARLGLARAYVLEGDRLRASAAYEDFLTVWRDADPDILVLREAKTEYSGLGAARSRN
ncbi:MAG TPA: hypothetical protein VMG82_03940 [Candidatus Sulfotelmatobacter sp.]|nr:hypothetical protein [Candidatus Sulfotelmatobacter sp.]